MAKNKIREAEMRAAKLASIWMSAPVAATNGAGEWRLIKGWACLSPLRAIHDILGWEAHKERLDITDDKMWAGWLTREMLVDEDY